MVRERKCFLSGWVLYCIPTAQEKSVKSHNNWLRCEQLILSFFSLPPKLKLPHSTTLLSSWNAVIEQSLSSWTFLWWLPATTRIKLFIPFLPLVSNRTFWDDENVLYLHRYPTRYALTMCAPEMYPEQLQNWIYIFHWMLIKQPQVASVSCAGQHSSGLFLRESQAFSWLSSPASSPWSSGLTRRQWIAIHLHTLCLPALRSAECPQAVKRRPAPALPVKGRVWGELMKLQRNPPSSHSDNPLLKGILSWDWMIRFLLEFPSGICNDLWWQVVGIS